MDVKVSILQPITGCLSSNLDCILSHWNLSEDVSLIDLVTLFCFLGESHLVDVEHVENGTEGANAHCDQTEVAELELGVRDHVEEEQGEGEHGDVGGVGEAVTVVNQLVTHLV